MFGLDQLISGLGQGASPVVLLAIALLLGLRHAADPDHLVAVSTLVATEREHRVRRASALGLAWGLGHATTLVALGLPFILVAALLPQPVQRGADFAVGVVIMLLALRLYRRWRAGAFHVHPHRHGEVVHRHLHPHAQAEEHEHRHGVRSPAAAYGIGVLHGVGGSAGIALLLLAGIANRGAAAAALAVFALATAASMALLSSALGLAFGTERVQNRLARLTPALAALALAFGACYAAAAALEVV